MKKLRKKTPKKTTKKRTTKMIIIDRRPKQIRDAILGTLLVLSLGILAWLLWSNGYFERSQKENVEKEPQVLTEDQKRQELRDAIKTNQFGSCSRIVDERDRTVCVNNIANNLAKEKGDPKYCERLDGKLMSREMCVREVMGKLMLEEEDIEICEKSGDPEMEKECREKFWTTKALSGNDIAVCERAEGAEQKNFCHDNFLWRTEYVENVDSFDCGKFLGVEMKSECQNLKEISKSRDLKRCSELETDLFKKLCASNL